MFTIRFEAVKGFVQKIAAKWRCAPPIEVVPTAADLPLDAPADARGLYWRRRVWLVANQPVESIAKTLNHEVVAHHGLRLVLKDKWHTFMAAFHRGIQTAKTRPLKRLRDQVKKAYVDRRGRCTLRPAQFADEIAAAAVEDCTSPTTGETALKRTRWKVRFSEVLKILHRPKKKGKVPVFGLHHLMSALRAAASKLKAAPTVLRKHRAVSKTKASRWRLKRFGQASGLS